MEVANDFSHTESSALPCAVDARLPTVHIVIASSSSSSSGRFAGSSCVASAKGRFVAAKEDIDSGRKDVKGWAGGGAVGVRPPAVWAR